MTPTPDLNSPLTQYIIKLTNAIDAQVCLEESDRVLLVMILDTKEKAFRFVNWVKSKTQDERLNTNPAEIMHAAAVISRGKTI